jgi:hypothetical protein
MSLEFFCNHEGHLEFRPPQWNKTPLAVRTELFRRQRDTGQSLVPEFLTQIFQTRTSSLRTEIHALNVRIVLISLLLGRYPDGSLIPGLSVAGEKSLAFFGVSQDNDTSGISQGTSGGTSTSGRANVAGISNIQDLNSLVDTGNILLNNSLSLGVSFDEDGDILSGDTETILGEFDAIFQEDRNVLEGVEQVVGGTGSPDASSIATVENLNLLRNDFRTNYGIDPGANLASDDRSFAESDFIFFASSSEEQNLNRANKLLEKLSDAISERDSLVTTLIRNEEKQEELEEVASILSGEFTDSTDAGPTPGGLPLDGLQNALNATEDILQRTSNTLRTVDDIFSGEATRGSLFDHLVEDDTRNLLGPGSALRYIIHDRDILQCSFSESPPDFTRIDVYGTAPFIGEELDRSFQNTYFWAGATDFDLWRKYGYKQQDVKLPFSSNADLQSKPFAILELQLQRVKVNRGSVTVVGNEYYRPGDVVYIPSKGLLYYVREVSHNLTFGTTFTTQLTLEFGHAPGTYLPSPLDIIGMQFTRDPLEGQVLIYKNQVGDDNYRALQPTPTLFFPDNVEVTYDNVQNMLDFRDNQVRFTNQMVDLSNVMIGNRVILVRGFIKTEDDANRDAVLQRMNVVKELLLNPVQITQEVTSGGGDDLANFVGNVFRSIGSSTGSNRGVTPLILPNGIPAPTFTPDQIVQQLVVLNKNGDVDSEIVCQNPELIGAQFIDSLAVSEDDVRNIFPKGGPKQAAWLDLRDSLDDVYSIVEIGILDIPNQVETAGESGINIT